MSRYRIETSIQHGWISPDTDQQRTKDLAPGWLILLGVGQAFVGVVFFTLLIVGLVGWLL